MYDLEDLGDRPVAEANREGHKRARPYYRARGPRTLDDLELVGVGDELEEVAREECPVALTSDHEIARGLAQPAHHSKPVALVLLLFDEPCPCLGDLPLGVADGVVVYYHHLFSEGASERG